MGSLVDWLNPFILLLFCCFNHSKSDCAIDFFFYFEEYLKKYINHSGKAISFRFVSNFQTANGERREPTGIYWISNKFAPFIFCKLEIGSRGGKQKSEHGNSSGLSDGIFQRNFAAADPRGGGGVNDSKVNTTTKLNNESIWVKSVCFTQTERALFSIQKKYVKTSLTPSPDDEKVSRETFFGTLKAVKSGEFDVWKVSRVHRSKWLTLSSPCGGLKVLNEKIAKSISVNLCRPRHGDWNSLSPLSPGHTLIFKRFSATS